MIEFNQDFAPNLVAPLIFMFSCILIYGIVIVLIYNIFLSNIIPGIVIKFVLIAGMLFILVKCIQNYETINSIVADWSSRGMTIGLVVFIIAVGVLGALIPNSKKKSRGKQKKSNLRKSNKPSNARRSSMKCRPDEEILKSPLEGLNGAEFERILALYFRDQGYHVNEVGVGGKDGGVDLVITDRRGEKTAVQAKCYAPDHNVGVQTVRELIGAKRNHDCILALLITTSDLTDPAKKEAGISVEYWHGALVAQKLTKWGKWNPNGKLSSQQVERNRAKQQVLTGRSQVAATSQRKCKCGAVMLIRKSKEGKSFWGCSAFPNCRYTETI